MGEWEGHKEKEAVDQRMQIPVRPIAIHFHMFNNKCILSQYLNAICFSDLTVLGKKLVLAN